VDHLDEFEDDNKKDFIINFVIPEVKEILGKNIQRHVQGKAPKFQPIECKYPKMSNNNNKFLVEMQEIYDDNDPDVMIYMYVVNKKKSFKAKAFYCAYGN
jgi:hypothetical protein